MVSAEPKARDLSPDKQSLDDQRNRWISEFVDLHGASAHRTAYRLLQSDEEARDAVQDCLVTVLKRWDELHSRDTAKAWFFRILVNDCISRQRKAKVRDTALRMIGSSSAKTCEPLEPGDFSATVVPELMRLPVKQRTALILRFADGRSLAEIADAMNVSRETIKTHLSRGLARLRKSVVSKEAQP